MPARYRANNNGYLAKDSEHERTAATRLLREPFSSMRAIEKTFITLHCVYCDAELKRTKVTVNPSCFNCKKILQKKYDAKHKITKKNNKVRRPKCSVCEIWTFKYRRVDGKNYCAHHLSLLREKGNPQVINTYAIKT